MTFHWSAGKSSCLQPLSICLAFIRLRGSFPRMLLHTCEDIRSNAARSLFLASPEPYSSGFSIAFSNSAMIESDTIFHHALGRGIDLSAESHQSRRSYHF